MLVPFPDLGSDRLRTVTEAHIECTPMTHQAASKTSHLPFEQGFTPDNSRTAFAMKFKNQKQSGFGDEAERIEHHLSGNQAA